MWEWQKAIENVKLYYMGTPKVDRPKVEGF